MPFRQTQIEKYSTGFLYFDTSPNPPLLKLLLVHGLAIANTHNCAATVTNMTVGTFHAGMCKGYKIFSLSPKHQPKHKNLTQLIMTTSSIWIMVLQVVRREPSRWMKRLPASLETLMIGAAGSSETFIHTYQTTRCHTPKDHNP